VLQAAGLFGFSVFAGAATFTVNTTDVIVRGSCSSLCSLPDALLLAHDGDVIAFNVGGGGHQVIDARGSSALFSTNGHVSIDGTTQPGYTLGYPVVEVKGAAFGLYNGSSLSGLALNDGSQIVSSAGSTISESFIGTDWTGTTEMGSPQFGIQAEGDGTVILENVIVARTPVLLVSNANHVVGNSINVDKSGTSCIGPASNDKSVYVAGYNSNQIGGNLALDRNVICAPGPGATAIALTGDNNTVQGNSIGVTVTGGSALPVGVGVDANGANNLIGGQRRNVIVAATGVQIEGSNTTVRGNYIGTDATGSFGLAPPDAVGILDGGSDTQIGGEPTDGNVISGNKQGILAGGSNATIRFNSIGLDATGTNPVPNTLVGVRVISGSPGVTTIQRNVIAYNNSSLTPGYGGVLVAANAVNAQITGGRGIVLGGFLNPPPNDVCDVDSGANGLQNYPVLTSVVSDGTSTTIQGTLDSTANTVFHVEFFTNLACDGSGFGQGALFVGDDIVTTDATCHASFSAMITPAIPSGQTVTATAADPVGNTSEFSACATASGTGGVSVDAITPTSGPSSGATQIAIRGSGFTAGATVQIGGQPATAVTVVTPGLLLATTPALEAGTQNDVTVASGAPSGTLVKGWVSLFNDVDYFNLFRAAIEQIFREGITAGCGGGNFCPNSAVRRDQMAVFMLKAEHGPDYMPPTCAGLFPDVPCPGLFTDYVEQFAAEGITGGCGGGLYCPSNPVTRQQMAVFLLKTEHGSAYMPPACWGLFGDVICPSQFADWEEQLYNEGVTGGCQAVPLYYCPTNEVTRAQMAAFLVKMTF